MAGNGPIYRSDVATPPVITSAHLDTAVNRKLIAQLRGDKPSQHLDGASADPEHGNNTSNAGLVMSMAKRLGVLEKASQRHASLVQTLQTENDALKRKLRVAEDEIALRAAAPAGAASKQLQSDKAWLCSQLEAAQAQVTELKDFLSDYGMVWVGGDNDSTPRSSRASSSSTGACALPTGASSWNPTIEHPSSARPRFARVSSPSLPHTVPPPALSEPQRSTSTDGGPSGLPSSQTSRPLSASLSARVLLHPLPLSTNSAHRLNTDSILAHQHTSPTNPTPRPAPAFTSPTPPPDASRTHPPTPHHAASLHATVSPPSAHQHMPSASHHASQAHLPAPLLKLPFNATLEELRSRIDDLNQLVGDGIGVVTPTPGPGHAHGIVTQQPVHMVLFRDGIQIHRAAARPFSDPVCRAVLRDILDGYFPALLKAEFPDGVPISLVENTSESITSMTTAHDSGNSRAGNVHTFADLEAGANVSAPMTRDRFLERLPQAIIRNGKVMDIREEVGRMLGVPSVGAGTVVALVRTPVDALLSTIQRSHTGPVLPPASRSSGSGGGRPPVGEVTTLQVKSENGSETFLLKLQFDDTVASLRQCIDAHRTGSGTSGPVGPQFDRLSGAHGSEKRQYEIRTAFPSRVYACETETLREAGLVPNATLFLKSVV